MVVTLSYLRAAIFRPLPKRPKYRRARSAISLLASVYNS